MLIQKILSFSLFIFLAVVFFLYWKNIDLPCEKPLLYSLGTVDPRFGISEKDFLSDIGTAENVWEKEFGRELFMYSKDAPFEVNLIFDERQLRTIDAQKLQASLEQVNDTQQNLTVKQNATLYAYRKAVAEYEDMASSFQKQLGAYNREVTKWNGQGGAPEDEYSKLQETAKSLQEKQQQIEKQRQKVNALASSVNAFSKQKVSVVNEYNAKVEQFANRYGEPKSFDQGDYVGTEINIYQFDDRAHLRAVLVHELGHALGLLHGGNPFSIMYPLMDKQKVDPITLSSEDKQMLQAECSQNIWDVVLTKLENMQIRLRNI